MPSLNYQNERKTVSETLLQRIARQDKTAVQECLDAYGGLVWSFAKTKTDSGEEAERLTLKIFDDLWKRAGQYDPARHNEVHFISLLARRFYR